LFDTKENGIAAEIFIDSNSEDKYFYEVWDA
jgi:hypothetical protein